MTLKKAFADQLVQKWTNPCKNGESDDFRRLKSHVKWHLTAGCSSSSITIWQLQHLSHQQLNTWPAVTNSRCHNWPQQIWVKTSVGPLWFGGWPRQNAESFEPPSCGFCKQGEAERQAVSATGRGRRSDPAGIGSTDHSGRMSWLCWHQGAEQGAAGFQRMGGTAALSSLGNLQGHFL